MHNVFSLNEINTHLVCKGLKPRCSLILNPSVNTISQRVVRPCHIYFAVMTCNRPLPLEHGSFSPVKDSYKYEDVVKFSCQTGFRLSGSNSVSCSDDGTFKPEPPTCTSKCFFSPPPPSLLDDCSSFPFKVSLLAVVKYEDADFVNADC